MTPDQILEGIKNETISDVDLKAAVETLSVEDQADLKKKTGELTSKTLSELNGIRREKNRVQGLLTEAEKAKEEAGAQAPAVPPVVTTSSAEMSGFRQEQKDKAIKRLQFELKLSDDDLKAVTDKFDDFDSGKVDADNILKDLKGVYAFLNSDTLLAAGIEKTTRERGAAEYSASAAAGAAHTEPGNNNQPPKYSKEVSGLAKAAGITEEAADKVATEGMKRVFR